MTPVSEWRKHVAWIRRHRSFRYNGLGFPELERFRMHHDPVFMARLLDTRWLRPKDVVVIASRRPSTQTLLLAVATRDRWLSDIRVQEALAANPFTPMAHVGALLPTVSHAHLVDIAAREDSAAQRAAAHILAIRRSSVDG